MTDKKPRTVRRIDLMGGGLLPKEDGMTEHEKECPEPKIMKITWDSEAKAVYICLDGENTKILKTVEVHGGEVYLHYNTGHELIGIEILNTNKPVVQDITVRSAK